MSAVVSGSVNRAGQPMIPIAVRKPGRQQFVTFNFIIDTGFNGDLQLSRSDIASLELTATRTINSQLADGQVVEDRVYPATALWQGSATAVEVIESERNIALIGAGLLWGSVMTVEWEFGGSVSVEPIA